MALIELKDVTKKYDKSTTALRHIDLSVNSGEFVYLVGPSGAGKSSLIRLFYQEEKLTSGSMKVGEFDLTHLRKKDVPLLRSGLFSRIINFFQRKQLLRMLLMRWRSSVSALVT